MTELKIIVRGEDTSLTKEFLIHEDGISLSHDDPTLSKMVQDTIADFKGIVDDVLLKFKYTW